MARPRAQGLIFYRVAASDAALADGQSTLGAFTFVMLISYLLPFAAIPIFVYDKQFYLRESGLGLYPTWAHTISQACAPAPTVAHRRHHSRHRCRPRLAQSHGATQHLLSGLLHAATGGQEETEPHARPAPVLPPSQAILEAWVLTLAATAETLILIPLCGLGGALGGGWQAWFTIFAVLTVSGCVGSSIVSFFAVILPSQAFAIVHYYALILAYLNHLSTPHPY